MLALSSKRASKGVHTKNAGLLTQRDGTGRPGGENSSTQHLLEMQRKDHDRRKGGEHRNNCEQHRAVVRDRWVQAKNREASGFHELAHRRN